MEELGGVEVALEEHDVAETVERLGAGRVERERLEEALLRLVQQRILGARQAWMASQS